MKHGKGHPSPTHHHGDMGEKESMNKALKLLHSKGGHHHVAKYGK